MEENKNIFNNPNDKAQRILNGVDVWCSYYRENPHRFVQDYFNLKLKRFQQILLNMMFFFTNFTGLASRGIGKTFLVAIFICAKCILYPNSKIIVVSKTRNQANEVLEKISKELIPNAPLLANEIKLKEMIITGQKAQIVFKNGSYIKVATANDNSRGNRATVLIVDEYVQTNKEIVDTILRKFLIQRRPKYKDNPIYANIEEPEQSIYLSSCWFKSHWSWQQVKDYCANMVKERSYFVCGIPYQLAIKENLLSRKKVEDEMSESTFNEISFMMEMGCLFFGESENAFFKYEDLIRARRITTPLYVNDIYSITSDKIIKYYHKAKGQIRLMCIDIAVMSSKRNKNDATAIFILELNPTDNGQYIRNVIYLETFEGGHGKNQALAIRKIFEDLECDYIVIDTNGVGMTVYDNLVDDIIDDTTNKVYPALQCCNDKEMSERYKGKDMFPRKVIYSIKANAKFNSACAFNLRDSLSRGKMRLLEPEEEFERRMNNNKYYKELTPEQKLNIKMPYIQTKLLIMELVNLEYITQGNEVKIKEQSDKRKDRYSALSYGNQIANDLELKLKKPKESMFAFNFRLRPPNTLKRK